VSITRLQQARQMYALGQRVAKTMDGSRPGYGGGADMGSSGSGGYQGGAMGGYGSGGGKGSSSNGSTSGGGGGQFRGPAELGTSTRTVNRITSKPPQEIIGGKSYDVTPETKDERERAEVLAQIMQAPIPNFTPKGIQFFKDNKLVKGFMPDNKPKFNFMDLGVTLGLSLLNPALGAKYRKAKTLYNTAKLVGGLATDIGLTDKNVVESFTDNLKSDFKTKSKKTSKPDINVSDRDEGIGSLKNQASNYNEYVLLLQKLQSGNISGAERTRYNQLKTMLGI